jgi:hypothetical protein
MTPYDPTWYGFIVVMILVGVTLYLALRHRSRSRQRLVLTAAAVVSVIVYTAFTFQSILNPNLPQVTLAQNLPLHLCQFVAFGLIAAYWFEWRWFSPRLRAFLFYIGTVSGAMALTSPVPYYTGHSVFTLPGFGFYFVHSMNAVLSVLLASLGFYQPRYRDAFRAVFHLLLLTTVILPLDLAMRAWVDPHVNYFYLFDPEGAGLLAIFHNWVPIPFVYMLFTMPIALIGCPLVNAAYQGVAKLVRRFRPQPLLVPAD